MKKNKQKNKQKHPGIRQNKPPRKRKGPWFRRTLCAVFAATVVMTGSHLLEDDSLLSGPDHSPPANDIPAAAVPSVLDAFGKSAALTDDSSSPFLASWQAVLSNESSLAQSDPAGTQRLDDYLAKFEQYSNQSLLEEARDVSQVVQGDLTYTLDDQLYGAQDYWAAPVQTVEAGRGDCEDYAILQYYVLRHLGVPEERLFFALVSADDASPHMDHMVLLLNIADRDQEPSYAVLNQGGPVVDSNYYVNGGTVPGWPDDYEFYGAFNNLGNMWQTADAEANIYKHGGASATILPAAVVMAALEAPAPKTARSAPPGLRPLTVKLG